MFARRRAGGPPLESAPLAGAFPVNLGQETEQR